jgi:hypothetical protein
MSVIKIKTVYDEQLEIYSELHVPELVDYIEKSLNNQSDFIVFSYKLCKSCEILILKKEHITRIFE